MGSHLSAKGAQQPPSFRPMSIVSTVAHLGYCWALVLDLAINHLSWVKYVFHDSGLIFSIYFFLSETLLCGKIISKYILYSSLLYRTLSLAMWRQVLLHLCSVALFVKARIHQVIGSHAQLQKATVLFSKREFMFTFDICCRPSVCRLSVCNARAPYSSGWNFRQCFNAIWYLAIRWHPRKILWRSSQGNPSIGGIKRKRGSQI